MTDQQTFYTYRLYHRLLSYSRDVRAPSAQEACEKLGWLIGDVWVSCPGSSKHPPDWEDVPRQQKDIPLQQLPPEKIKGE